MSFVTPWVSRRASALSVSWVLLRLLHLLAPLPSASAMPPDPACLRPGAARGFPLTTWRGGSCLRGEGLGLTPSLPLGVQEGAGTGLLSQFDSPPGRKCTVLMRPPWI